jgi:hypothetical protein
MGTPLLFDYTPSKIRSAPFFVLESFAFLLFWMYLVFLGCLSVSNCPNQKSLHPLDWQV